MIELDHDVVIVSDTESDHKHDDNDVEFVGEVPPNFNDDNAIDVDLPDDADASIHYDLPDDADPNVQFEMGQDDTSIADDEAEDMPPPLINKAKDSDSNSSDDKDEESDGAVVP